MASNGTARSHTDDTVDGIERHAFVESGPGQEPTTIKGCIVCPECYQPERSQVHMLPIMNGYQHADDDGGAYGESLAGF